MKAKDKKESKKEEKNEKPLKERSKKKRKNIMEQREESPPLIHFNYEGDGDNFYHQYQQSFLGKGFGNFNQAENVQKKDDEPENKKPRGAQKIGDRKNYFGKREDKRIDFWVSRFFFLKEKEQKISE